MVWQTAKAAIPHMVAAGNGGSIIATSSLAGLKPFADSVSYVASKFGVVGVVRVLAHELAEHRIRVSAVHPTNVNTPMLTENESIHRLFRPDLENPMFDDVKDAYGAVNLWPMGYVESIDISNAVLWSASEEARYVTGISLPVDLGGNIK